MGRITMGRMYAMHAMRPNNVRMLTCGNALRKH